MAKSGFWAAEIFHCSLPTANRIKKGGTTRLSISGMVPWQNQESHHPDRSQDHCGQEVGIRTGWATCLSAQRHVTILLALRTNSAIDTLYC